MSKPRVVLDTNIFVAAGFNPDSHSARVIRAVREGDLELVWDDTTRGETERIVTQIPPLAWDAFASLFRKDGRFGQSVDAGEYGEVPGSMDRRFAALADAAGATLISLDDDLLKNRDSIDTAVMTPTEFCRSHFERSSS